MDEILKYWEFLYAIVTTFVGWVAWSIRKQMVSRQEFEEARADLVGKVATIDSRVVRLEAESDQVKELSGKVEKLSDKFAELGGDVREMKGTVKVVADQINLIYRAHIGEG
ncbi:MAG: DUF2730 family protein [Magnetococcales bacterium]|nr:DUF2730 family protein [Magnetococcales bacterium]